MNDEDKKEISPAEQQGNQEWWMFVPSKKELEQISEFDETHLCPKCHKGKIAVMIEHNKVGQGLSLKCKYGEHGCDWEKDITDYDIW